MRSAVALGAFVTRLPAAQVRHVVQTRGDVAEPADEANVPPVHVGCGLHVAWPGSSWYLLVPSHAVAAAPLGHLKPGGHAMQLVALARYEPAPHTEQCAAFSVVLYSVVSSQLVQVRSDAASGAFATRLPAAQVRHGWHTVSVILVPTSEANESAVHTA